MPAWWWSQNHTPPKGESIYVEFEFLPHSMLWSMVNQGIEREVIANSEEDFEETMVNWSNEDM